MRLQEYIFKINTRIKVFGGFLILIVVSYLLYNFSITPLLNQRKTLSMNLFSQRRLVKTRKAYITEINSLEVELEEGRKELENIEVKFITEEELPSFFAELRDLASENNINISNLRVGEKRLVGADSETETPGHEELPVNISLNGDYLDIVVFFAQLRKKPVMFSIPRLLMIVRDKEDKFIATDLQLTLYPVHK